MFCTKCGKEIENHAVICPECGYPTENKDNLSPDSKSNSVGFNSASAQVARFSEEVKTIWIFSLLFVLLFMEIGFAFGIFVYFKLKKLPRINTDLTDPRDYAEYQRACIKLNNAKLLFRFGIVLFILAVLIGIIILIANL